LGDEKPGNQTSSGKTSSGETSNSQDLSGEKLSGEHGAKSERRHSARQSLEDAAEIVFVRSGLTLPGRILDLSMSGCRIRTEKPFPLGIYTRVETDFRIDGLPLRLGGVIQAIHDGNTVGIRFLDVSERKREQVQELIDELAALRTAQTPLDPASA
jgi:hypothetical protein